MRDPHVFFSMFTIHPPTLADRARWAVALYATSWESGEETTQRRDRKMGIRRYKNAPGARLRADLEPILKAYPDGTVQYSAAAYVLARYGIDTERNTARLFSSARMGRGDVFPNQESLPEALADIWIVRRSPTALAHLVDMPSDGHVGEEQGDNLARVFAITPDAVLRAAARSRSGWEQLVFGIEGRRLPSGRGIHEQALLARLRRDAKRFE